MQIVSIGDNLHEMSNPVSWKKFEKYFKNIVCWKLMFSTVGKKNSPYYILKKKIFLFFRKQKPISLSLSFFFFFFFFFEKNIINLSSSVLVISLENDKS